MPAQKNTTSGTETAYKFFNVGVVQPPQLKAGESLGEHTITFLASSSTIDRDREIVDPKGWKLDTYMTRNPVFLADHEYSIDSVIGRAAKAWVDDEGLKLTVDFAVGANPRADTAYRLYKGGFLHSVSVGFRPMRVEQGSEALGYRRRFLEQELLEVSAVAIPANPDAVAITRSIGGPSMKALLKLLTAAHETAPEPTPDPMPGVEVDPKLRANLEALAKAMAIV